MSLPGSSEDVNINFVFQAYREESFHRNWPFPDVSKLSARGMAEAGFYYANVRNAPDLVQCYVCFKELEGWEEDDDPWVEHSRSTRCDFIKLNKKECDMSVEQFILLAITRRRNLMQNVIDAECNKLEKDSEAQLDKIIGEREKGKR